MRMDVNEGMKGFERNHPSIGLHNKVIREREMNRHPESQICRRRGFSMRHSAIDVGSSREKLIEIKVKINP